MPLSNASRLADFGTGIGTAGAIIQVDNANQRLGVGTTAPTATLGVAGIVSATAFYGDGSNLDGVASAGLGTALSEEEFNPLTVIYQTSDTLSVGATITVDPPDATTKVAYTQYSDIKLEGDADLIIADGDDFIPDILGLSTEGFSFSNANGNGIFDTVYTDNIENAAGRGAPNFPLGITVSGISTLSGNVSIGGTLTYEDVTNVDSIGVVTARSGVDINAGGLDITAGGIDVTAGGINVGGISTLGGNVNIAGNAQFTVANPQLEFNNGGPRLWSPAANTLTIHTGGGFGSTSNERLRIGSAGQIGLSGANYGTSGQVLTSQGGSAAPQWASVSAGIWSTLASGTSSGATGTITANGITSSYEMYRIVFYAVMDGEGQLGVDITTDGGSSWSSTATGWTISISGRESNSNWGYDTSSQSAGWLLGANRNSYWGEITFADTQNSSRQPTFNFVGGAKRNSYNHGATLITNMTWPTNTAFNGIRWYQANQLITSVKWVLQGTTFS